MAWTIKGTLKKGGCIEGKHYKIVPRNEVLASEPEIFTDRKRGYRHLLLGALSWLGVGAVVVVPNPQVQAVGIALGSIALVGLAAGKTIYHVFRTGKAIKNENALAAELAQERATLFKHAKTLDNLKAPVVAAAFTIGGGKIFFLTKQARDHLLKVGKWSKSKTSFDLQEEQKE